MRQPHWLGWLLVLCLMACVPAAPPPPAADFRLQIFQWPGGTAEKDAVLFTVTPAEMAQYQWDVQIIALTAPATLSLTAATQAELTARSPALADLSLPVALDTHPFAVLVDEQVIYTGTILPVGSARSSAFPVMYVGEADGQAFLHLRPEHPAWDDPAWPWEHTRLHDARVQAALEPWGVLVP